MFWNLFGIQDSSFRFQEWYWQVAIIVLALVVFVGATNIINFMDGINGITSGYSLAVLVPLQLVVSLGFVYLCPDTVLAHWVYLIVAIVVLAVAYVLFMKKYYHLHEEYLASLKR